MHRRCSALALGATLALATITGSGGALIAAAHAEGDEICRVMSVDFTPTDDLQIVVWLEDAAGNYIDTSFITRLTGSYGLGNRPGMMEFNTAWRWPYGRRITTFPVWAHRHGIEFPAVVFQNGREANLSHPFNQSSVDNFYCRPLYEEAPKDIAMWDAETCATTAFTDKGRLADDEKSLYPPREDFPRNTSTDDESVLMYEDLNPFDAVSRATPSGGATFSYEWVVPHDLPNGDYVVWIEVAKELDQNETYQYPEPEGISWGEFGIPYRGQPSVLWKLPISISDGESKASTLEWFGYGDPDGIDGDVRVPDESIATTPGSGAGRLLVTEEDGEMYKLRVSARPSLDHTAPAQPEEMVTGEVEPTSAVIRFVAPGDDGLDGVVGGYQVRYRAGEPLTADNFDDATLAGTNVSPDEPGSVQSFLLDGLLPSTHYYVGIRAHDECFNLGDIALIELTTPAPEIGSVDACFVATAAYGSLMANDVGMLRSFRDTYLRSNVLGELFVEAYYTFGPAVAELVGESDTARRAARAGLAPLVQFVRRLTGTPARADDVIR